MKNRCYLLSFVFLFLVSCSSTSTTPTACTTNASCTGATDTCQSGKCQPQTASNCKTNAACASGYTCGADSKCGCGSVDHCASTDLCVSGSCAVKCTNSNTCGPTQTCQSGTCQAQIATNCKTDAVCTNQFCINTQCTTIRYAFASRFGNNPSSTGFTAPTSSWTTAATLPTPQPSFNSATDADKLCQFEADNMPGSLVKGKKFAAWLASKTQSPLDKVLLRMNSNNDSADVYIPVAATGTAAATVAKVSGPIKTNPASTDFAGTSHVGGITTYADGKSTVAGLNSATGSQSSTATAKIDGSENCNDWTNGSGSVVYGSNSNTLAPTWYNSTTGTYCNFEVSIYCVEVDK